MDTVDKERKLIIALAENAMLTSVWCNRACGVGEMILRLPEEKRAILRTLKSRHVEGVSPFWLRWSPPPKDRRK